MPYKVCIIGSGVTGLLLLLLLQQRGTIPLHQICIVDPQFDGGDLLRSWPSIHSNTRWRQTTAAIQEFLPSLQLPVWATTLDPEAPTPVGTIATLLRELALPALGRVQRIQGHVVSAAWATSPGAWTVTIRAAESITLEAEHIAFCHGAVPKSLGLPCCTLPLSVALDQSRLQQIVKPEHRVTVFGTAHSGILVLKHLMACGGPPRVTAFHRGAAPFQFARDGAYDGLKLESAAFADEVLAGQHPTIRLRSTNDIGALIRETVAADWVIVAIGFEPNDTITLTVDGRPASLTAYNSKTGALLEAPNAFGFGIAYPSQAPDGIHVDVGVAPFLAHMAGVPLQ